MTLYIRAAADEAQCVFYIFDRREELLWKVHLVDGTPGKMQLSDMDGQTLLNIQPSIVSLYPKYHVSIAGMERVRIVYKAGFSRNPALTGIGWDISGEVCTGNYAVQDRGGQTIFNHEKKWGAGGEYVELETILPENALLAAGIAVAIDQTIVVTPQAQPV